MTYTEFVASRVKWLPTVGEDLHHAATGICGEAIELAAAEGRSHIFEELGDIEFYIEHFEQALRRWDVIGEVTLHDPKVVTYSTLDASEALKRAAGTLLDLTKKVWIYNKDPNKLAFELPLLEIQRAMDKLSELVGESRETLRAANQRKLEIRYPTGYSDAAAQARADKPQGE